MATELKHRWIPAIVLTIAALIVAASLSFTAHRTKDRIAANQRAYDMRQIDELLAGTRYDNDVFNDAVRVGANAVDAGLLGPGDQHLVFRARSDQTVTAAVLQVTAANGYSGYIELLVAIFADGTLAGVRATQHRETPGLGDQIDMTQSDWMLIFNGRLVDDPPRSAWRIRRDGGQFDQITGASVTSRAVTDAVHNALVYFERHQQILMTAPIDSELP